MLIVNQTNDQTIYPVILKIHTKKNGSLGEIGWEQTEFLTPTNDFFRLRKQEYLYEYLG